MTRDPYANVTAAYRDAWARNTAALVLLTPPLRDRFRSLIAAVTDLAGAMPPPHPQKGPPMSRFVWIVRCARCGDHATRRTELAAQTWAATHRCQEAHP